MSVSTSGSVCSNCGELINDPPGGDPAAREPCPKCGSMARTFGVSVDVISKTVVTAHATVITYPRRLLSVAQSLINSGEFAIAVIVAHVACEVATERVMAAAFTAKGIQDLEKPVKALLPGRNLGNNRIRKLYTALTGDAVQNQPFWSKFTISAELRNDIVHGDPVTPTKQNADDSWAACDEFVKHLKQG